MKNRQWKQAAEGHGGKFSHAVEASHDVVKTGKTEKERKDLFVGLFIKNAQLMLEHNAPVEDFFDALQHTAANSAVIVDSIKHGIAD